MIHIRLRWFASLAETVGRTEEKRDIDHQDAARLYDDLKAQFGLKPQRAHVRLAVNDRFVDWTTPLANGDTVVFIPPVSGG